MVLTTVTQHQWLENANMTSSRYNCLCKITMLLIENNSFTISHILQYNGEINVKVATQVDLMPFATTMDSEATENKS